MHSAKCKRTPSWWLNQHKTEIKPMTAQDAIALLREMQRQVMSGTNGGATTFGEIADVVEEARQLIGHIGWTSVERPDVLEKAEQWMGHKPNQPSRQLCDRHPNVDYKRHWGCPECLIELRNLLDKGLTAADGAITTMNAWAEFGLEAGNPYNNDNYCRLKDWQAAAKKARGEEGK